MNLFSALLFTIYFNGEFYNGFYHVLTLVHRALAQRWLLSVVLFMHTRRELLNNDTGVYIDYERSIVIVLLAEL